MIENDRDLYEYLASAQNLTDKQVTEICSLVTRFARNNRMLQYIKTEEQCQKLLSALEEMEQQHLAKFIQHGVGQ